MNYLRPSLYMWLVPGILASAPLAYGEQPLSDFRRVVIADQASGVQKAAAEELVHYIGIISDQPLEKVGWSEYTSDAPGLSFFVGGTLPGGFSAKT